MYSKVVKQFITGKYAETSKLFRLKWLPSTSLDNKSITRFGGSAGREGTAIFIQGRNS
jgi:hypothetical protein